MIFARGAALRIHILGATVTIAEFVRIPMSLHPIWNSHEFRYRHKRAAAMNEFFHTNPKRERGSDLTPSLAHRVSVINGREPYNLTLDA